MEEKTEETPVEAPATVRNCFFSILHFVFGVVTYRRRNFTQNMADFRQTEEKAAEEAAPVEQETPAIVEEAKAEESKPEETSAPVDETPAPVEAESTPAVEAEATPVVR